MHYIGIDPSFRKGGFAVCVIDEESEACFTIFQGGLLQFIGWVLNDAPDEAVVAVENSNLQNITFNMNGTKAEIAKRSRNVGTNQAASEYTYQICKYRYGKNAHEISPKDKGAKRTHDTIKMLAKSLGHTLTNYKGLEGEQDKRDAYSLAIIAMNKKVSDK